MNEAATTPEDRAETAARDLADRGLAVTARAVREAAGVRMAVATQTAKAWREATQEDNAVTIPETPEDVKGRLDAIWADAYRAALAAVTPERDRLAAEAETLRAEVEALTVAVTEVEDERPSPDQSQRRKSPRRPNRADPPRDNPGATPSPSRHHQPRPATNRLRKGPRPPQQTTRRTHRKTTCTAQDRTSEKTRHHEENHHHPEELTAAYMAYNGRPAHPKSRGDLFIRQTISPQPLSCVQSLRSHHRGTPWHLSL